MSRLLTLLPGLTGCVLVTVIAVLLGDHLLMGSVMLAMVLGLVISSIRAPSARLDPGFQCAEQTLLSLAIVLMGFSLDLQVLTTLGSPGLVLILISTLSIAVTVAGLILLRPEHRTLSVLLGMGTLVCGTAAIAAAARPLSAKRETVCLAVAVVNLLGLVAMFLLPVLGSSFATLSEVQAGVLIGNSLPAVGQVASAGYTLGESAGQTALLMKMARILMLVPLLLVISVAVGRSVSVDQGRGRVWYQNVPLFLPGFVLSALMANLAPIPVAMMSVLATFGDWLLIMAMAAIGLRLSIPRLLREGRSAMLGASLLLIVLITITVLSVSLVFP